MVVNCSYNVATAGPIGVNPSCVVVRGISHHRGTAPLVYSLRYTLRGVPRHTVEIRLVTLAVTIKTKRTLVASLTAIVNN